MLTYKKTMPSSSKSRFIPPLFSHLGQFSLQEYTISSYLICQLIQLRHNGSQGCYRLRMWCPFPNSCRAYRLTICQYSMYGHIQKLAEAEKKGIESAGGKVDIFQ